MLKVNLISMLPLGFITWQYHIVLLLPALVSSFYFLHWICHGPWENRFNNIALQELHSYSRATAISFKVCLWESEGFVTPEQTFSMNYIKTWRLYGLTTTKNQPIPSYTDQPNRNKYRHILTHYHQMPTGISIYFITSLRIVEATGLSSSLIPNI